MDNSEKIILDLCGGTGAWSKPYKDAGYDVRLITLPNYDVLTYEPPDKVHGVIENPVGRMKKFMGNPDYTFQFTDFGFPCRKKSLLGETLITRLNSIMNMM